jgi:queuine/archaeosine tRNA-ribosyltransferase
MTQIEFFPAAMVGHFNKIEANPELKFWGDTGIFKYDKLLYSYHYLQDRYKKDKTSYFKRIGYTGKLMLDSGGFQVRSLGVKIEPEDVIKTYELEKPTVGIILDAPFSIGWEDDRVDYTYKNVIYMAEQKHRIPNTELINILHGFTLNERKRYYEKFKIFNDKLDGWCSASPKKYPPIYDAWTTIFLYEQDNTLKNKRLHFLGLTGNKKMPVIYYLAKLNLIKTISFDSTKYGREGLMYDIRNPSFLGERLSISKNAKGKLKSNSFCPCPVCSNTTIEQMQSDCNYSILHNLFWEIKKFDFFDSFESAEDWKNHIMESKEYSPETRIAIKFIDYALKYGLDQAEIKFKYYFNKTTNPRQAVL